MQAVALIAQKGGTGKTSPFALALAGCAGDGRHAASVVSDAQPARLRHAYTKRRLRKGRWPRPVPSMEARSRLF